MFFLKDSERTITLHPQMFGPRTRDILTHKLKEDVEGTNMGNHYIISIIPELDISEGRIVPGSGYAEYTINYRAVVWRPFKGEVLDATVNKVLELGFHVDIGPMPGFVSKASMPSDFKFDGNATPPNFSDSGGYKIEKGSRVRLKIMGVRAEIGSMYGVGTIKEDYLGPLPEDGM